MSHGSKWFAGVCPEQGNWETKTFLDLLWRIFTGPCDGRSSGHWLDSVWFPVDWSAWRVLSQLLSFTATWAAEGGREEGSVGEGSPAGSALGSLLTAGPLVRPWGQRGACEGWVGGVAWPLVGQSLYLFMSRTLPGWGFHGHMSPAPKAFLCIL